jgi:O-antigen ligase
MQRAARPAVLLASAALLFSALFFGGGERPEDLFWVGAFAVATAAAVASLALVGLLPVPLLSRSGVACVVLLLVLLAYVGLTMAWSIAGDRSWWYFDRGLVYVAFVGLGLFAASVAPARVLAGGLAALLALVLLWALAGKMIPALFSDGARVARLREPIGYWNSLALVAATALPLALWIAARRRELRAVGAALAYLAVLVLALTYSRGGIVVAVLAAAGWIVVTRRRFESLSVVAIALAAGGGVAGWAFTRPALTDDGQPYQARVDDGAWFGLIAFAGLVVVAAAAFYLPDPGARRRMLERAFATVLVAGALGAAIGVVVHEGGIRELSDTKQVTQGPERFGDVSSSNRWTWWQEAWAIFEDHPAGGTGAGTFEIARRPIRDSAVATTEPHNLPLQFLAETGVFGFLLLLGAIATGAVAAVRSVRRAGAPAFALALGAGAYVLHSLIDLHFDFLAVSAPAFFVLGVLLALGDEAGRARRPLLALVPTVLAVAALYALTAPWLSNRYIDDAYNEIGTAAAVDDARTAHSLNPLAIDPLHAIAESEAARGHLAAATRRYEDATRLQPENSSTWYALGAWEYALGHYRRALRFLDRAYGLDPWGPAGRRGGLLDQARAKVEGRECC